MNVKLVTIIFITLFLSACGTSPYIPKEYPLRDGLIPKLSVNSSVTVNNSQDLTDEAIVYSYAGSKLASNYKDITQLMVQQAGKEISKNFSLDPSENKKTIDLKVNYLKSTYIAFFWKSELKYTAVLGNNISINKTVKHSSGVLSQDLNGCIAESVIDLLNDPDVLAYLSE